MIIITADDYGKNKQATDNILKCGLHGRISAASMMVFMEDSERAASFSIESGLEFGLHLNFTESFNGRNVSRAILQHQNRIKAYLRAHRYMHIFYNPFLIKSFNIVFQAQEQEFIRLYGKQPDFYNGHHHMHLCSNMIFSKLFPVNARIRRTYTFDSGEKNFFNLCYRAFINRLLLKRFISTDAFLSILPIQDSKRLFNIFKNAKIKNIEVEVHPETAEETVFLLSAQFQDLLSNVQCVDFRSLNC